MILVDANLLIYAYDSSARQHEPARDWLIQVVTGREPVRLAWITVLAFVRIMTNVRLFERPLTVAEAITIVEEWFAQPAVDVLCPSERHWEVLRALLIEGQAIGPLVMDAHLAALAIEHGATLHSTDRDFTRFRGLSCENPLETP